MIHHISIAVENPLHVAQVLAELLGGKAVPFASHPHSYVALALDAYGTMIEVHPHGMELRPGTGKDEVQHQINSASSVYTATHAAISVSASEADIRAIATREGWRVERYKRGDFFEVIEFWLENQMLVELLPPELSDQYLAFMQPEALSQFLAAA